MGAIYSGNGSDNNGCCSGVLFGSLQTVNATPTFFTQTVTLTDDTVLAFEARVVAVQTAGAAGAPGDVTSKKVKGVIRNIGGVTSIIDVNTTETTSTSPDAILWEVIVEADDATDALKIKVVGEVNKTINWELRLDTLENTF